MSECLRCGRQGTHACPPGPPLSRLYSDALAELAYQRARKESAERVVRLLVGVDRTVVRTVKEFLLLLGANKRAMDDRPDEAVLLLSPDLCQRLTDALVSWEAALAAAAALGLETGPKGGVA